MSADTAAGAELVVLCAPDGRAIATAEKHATHHHDTPLHLAFSCWLTDTDGRVLMSRRAHSKRTFPGVRSNSCCGHPAPGEALTDAVARRLRQELGIRPQTVRLVLPTFQYRARTADGMLENELCPVYLATVADTRIDADPAEVADAWWVPWPEFVRAEKEQRFAHDPLSPWSALQLTQLSALGADPADWPAADPADLPAAARRDA